MKFFKIISTLFLILNFLSVAKAQSSLDDIKAQLDSNESELDEVDRMLADTNTNRRIGAMKALIDSGNPIFIKKAKEVGLFSSDEQMKLIALKAILDSGGPFKLILDPKGKSTKETGLEYWLDRYDGSWNPNTLKGEYVFSLGPFSNDNKCWPWLAHKSCAVTLVGKTISLNSWQSANGTLTLGNDGIMSGAFKSTTGRRVPVTAIMNLFE